MQLADATGAADKAAGELADKVRRGRGAGPPNAVLALFVVGRSCVCSAFAAGACPQEAAASDAAAEVGRLRAALAEAEGKAATAASGLAAANDKLREAEVGGRLCPAEGGLA